MKLRTKQALIDLTELVQLLAQGCIHQIGEADCRKILESAEDARKAIEQEQTVD